MADSPSDDEEVDDERLPECFGPLPSDLHFPPFGLSDTFTGQRFLFQWERLLGMDRPAPNPVAWVALVHRSGTRFLEVITFGKQPWTSFGQLESKVDMKDVAYAALFGHLQLVSMKMPLGEVRGSYQTAQLAVVERLAQDFDAPEWQHMSLVLEGEPKDALVYRQDGAWAAVLDLDEHLALAMRGVGIESDEHELVAIEDLSRYRSQLATRHDESGEGFADAGEDTLERPFVRDTTNALALQTARMSAGLSLEALTEASGVDITRLRDAEDTESRVDLTFGEWVRLAVVFQGHTLAEFQAQQKAKGVVKYLVQGDQMLESARGLVQYYFSDDAPAGEDT